MENTQEISQQSQETFSQPVPPKKSIMPLLWYILFLFLGIVIGVGGYVGYQMMTKEAPKQQNDGVVVKEEEKKPEVKEEEKPKVEEPKPTDYTTGKMYYSPDSKKIYEYDYKTNSTKLIYTAKTAGLRDILVVDIQTLGFAYCNTVTNNFGCVINLFDLGTKKVTLLSKLEADVLILDLGFYDKNTYGYLSTKGKRWQLKYVDGKVVKTLENVVIAEGYGRGGYYEDASDVKFNPTGKYLLQISTSSPRDVKDFNTYVYNLTTFKRTKIANSTHSTWLNENTVVYRKLVDDLGQGLFTYDLTNSKSTLLQNTDKDSFNPVVLKGEDKILFLERTAKKLWVYDVSDGDAELAASNAGEGLWIDTNVIVWSQIEDCVEGDDECFMSDTKVVKVNNTDLITKMVTEVVGLKYLYSSTSSANN